MMINIIIMIIVMIIIIMIVIRARSDRIDRWIGQLRELAPHNLCVLSLTV